MRTVRRVLITSIIIFFAWFLVHTLVVTWDGLHDEVGVVDVAVVFGSKVEENGLPSARLKSRLDKAAELYREGLAKSILVSGGLGIEGYEEAEVMRDYLVSQNVPDQDVFVDRNGYNTCATAQNAKKVLQEKNLHTVIIVSQYYHIARAKLAFSQVGIENVYAAHAEIFELRDVYSLAREFFAYYGYLFAPCEKISFRQQ